MEHRTNETPLLQTIGLQKYFKVRGNSLLHAVDGIDLTLYSGQTLGVVGESGCGKSTLGRTILKLIEPTGGQILYNGKDITKLSTRKMHPLPQGNADHLPGSLFQHRPQKVCDRGHRGIYADPQGL